MADVDTILAAFRQELIDAGLVRAGSVAGDRPPMIVEPIAGAPAPGELEGVADDDELVLSLMHSGDLAEATGYDAAMQRRAVLDVRYRSKTSAALRRAQALDAAIRNRLIGPDTFYGYGFFIGHGGAALAPPRAPLMVLEVGVYTGLSPLGRSRAGGYDHVAKYLVVTAP